MAEAIELLRQELGRVTSALRRTERRLHHFSQMSQDVLWAASADGCRFEFVSPAFVEIWGREPSDLIEGRLDLLATVHPEDRANAATLLSTVMNGRPVGVTFRVVRPDGMVRWVHNRGIPIQDEAGRVEHAVGISSDITRSKRLEVERERGLVERELMLREINHRVKNNLQVITSLLRLQAGRAESEDVRQAFADACNRVSTIAELHAGLFQGVQIGRLDFGAYLGELCLRLQSGATEADSQRVAVRLEAEPALIDLDRAVALGLIANELVANAIRHGRLDDGTTQVDVSLRRFGESYRLEVKDEGRGMDATEVDSRRGLGMQLIGGLVRRIQGRLSVRDDAGLVVTVDLPAEQAGAA